MKAREIIIENYIEGYNTFNVQQMLRDVDDSIQFKNIQQEEVTLELNGIGAFRQQAEQAISNFSERNQDIHSLKHENGAVEIEVYYRAIAAQDLPAGIKKGQAIHLTGTSLFTFNKENKIISITDVS